MPLSNEDIKVLLEIAGEEEPNETPHSWCLDWTLRAEEYLQEQGFLLRETRYEDQYNLRAQRGPHLWVELLSGEIIDGTVGQFCRDDLWILPAGHPLRALYIYVGPEGRPAGSALLHQAHPLVADFDSLGGTSGPTGR